MKVQLSDLNHRLSQLQAFRSSVARLLHLRDIPHVGILQRLQTLCNAHQVWCRTLFKRGLFNDFCYLGIHIAFKKIRYHVANGEWASMPTIWWTCTAVYSMPSSELQLDSYAKIWRLWHGRSFWRWIWIF